MARGVVLSKCMKGSFDTDDLWVIADGSDLCKPHAQVMPDMTVTTVETAMQSIKQHKAVSWVLDSGFDDVAHWRTIWEHDSHLVFRVQHRKRDPGMGDCATARPGGHPRNARVGVGRCRLSV